MNRNQLQVAAIILTVITAAIHLWMGALALGQPGMWPLNALWLLNGLGYIGLMMAAYARAYIPFPFPRDKAPWILLGYTVLTILAWVALGGVLQGNSPGAMAIITKLVEVLLIVAIVLRQRAMAAARSGKK